jgi:hypothetical protein
LKELHPHFKNSHPGVETGFFFNSAFLPSHNELREVKVVHREGGGGRENACAQKYI